MTWLGGMLPARRIPSPRSTTSAIGQKRTSEGSQAARSGAPKMPFSCQPKTLHHERFPGLPLFRLEVGGQAFPAAEAFVAATMARFTVR